MPVHHYLACDLGAESGRLILGSLADGKLSLRELHRFQNVPIREQGSLRWNIPNLVLEVKEGLRKAVATGLKFESISTDSWGVDYVLFDQTNEMMEPVFHYRDSRTKRGVENALSKASWETIFAESGIQYMPLNTLFQLASEEPGRLEPAKLILGIGDAINYFLSGVPKIEVSMASTFQLYNPKKRQWSDSLISSLGLPRRIFPEIVPSGTRLGPIRRELAIELGISPMEVIASCSHDTGAAVAGVPVAARHWAYLSSGTWSLMGVELPEPIINDRARELNFTNEIGFGDTVRFLKNISGLWLIQECRREWSRQGKEFDYATLTKLAENAPPFVSLINPASEEFLAPNSMPAQIADLCRRTHQPVPENEGAYIRCALESLALLYRRTLRQIEEVTHAKIECLQIVGGGSNNELLNQFTANAVQIPVLAGPSEATAVGNILIQAISLKNLPSLEAARAVVRDSTDLKRFEPRDQSAWDQAFSRFEGLAKT
jgi:rhamnulokinase